MRLSWSWLSELVDLRGVSVDEAARLLPLRTADVEGVERLGTGLAGVVTARVLAVEPHPGADRLRLCTVDFGAAAPLRVVCGAPNVAAGQVVCFAPVGTTLPNGVTLKKARIRGVDSEGMICAEDELGLGAAHDGIVVLPEGTAVGVPVADALGVADAVLDVSNSAITSRPDLWGHRGFARELAAILDRALTPAPAPHLAPAAGSAPFPVRIDDETGCRRYVGLVVEGLVVGEPSATVRRRLEATGQRSIDRVVDATTYAMLETGHPLHAFDLREVRGGRVVVRRARAGETLRTLDGRDLALVEEDLVVADAERPLALAGVIGGEASAVRADTTSVLLEAAAFDAARVRRSAIRHGIRTEASTRFEKSLDPEGALEAARLAVRLLVEACPTARLARTPTDVYPRPYPPLEITLPFALVAARLGVALEPARVRALLASVGFASEPVAGGLRVAVPSWRATKDVGIPEDLVEEVGRLHGYEHVVPTPPSAPMRPRAPSAARRLESDGRAILSLDLGYDEIAAYAFHGAADAARLGIAEDALLRLANPLSAEQDRMQATSAQNLLRAAVRNRPREGSLRLCEWTRAFPRRSRTGAGAGASAAPSPTVVHETPVVGLLAGEAATTADPTGRVFLSLVADVRALLGRLGLGDMIVSDATAVDSLHDDLPAPGWLHPGRRAAVRADGVVVALVGELAPSVARAFALEGRTALAEVNLARALAAGREGRPYRAPARFPFAPFDVAVVVPRRTPASEVAALLVRSAPDAVRDVRLFDVYEGAGIPEGRRSLAFTVTFGDDERTLEPKAIEALQRRAVGALERAGYVVRTAAPPRSPSV